MVSIKFWRGKFSQPATGYECIAHALAFDRGVPFFLVLDRYSSRFRAFVSFWNFGPLPQFPTFSKWRLYLDVLLGEFVRSLWRKDLL